MVGTTPKIVVGIDIGSSMTRIIVAEESPRPQIKPKILGIGYSETIGMNQGYIVSSREVVASISEAVRIAEKNSGIEIRRAYVAIGGIGLTSEIGTGAVSASRPDGEITEEDVINVALVAKQAFESQRKNIKVLHDLPLKYRLDGIEVLGSPLGMKGSRLEARMVFITVLEHHFNELVSAITNAGIDIIQVIASPLAENFIGLTRKQRTVGCGLLNIGSDTTSLVVFDNDIPVSLKVFPVGSSHITNDLALGLQISLEEAEELKIKGVNHTKHPKKKYEEIIHARLEQIIEMVQEHLRSIKRDGLLPAGIIIGGGGASLPQLPSIIREILALPASLIETQVTMNTKRELDTSWLVAYGLCLLDDDEPYYSTRFIKNVFKETKKNILKLLREFLP